MNILEFKGTYEYSRLKSEYDYIFKTKSRDAYIFCKPLLINGGVYMEIVEYNALNGLQKKQYRVIFNLGTVNWFKYKHETFSYLI